MKKVFIGLLITAAGAGIFFLLQKKNKRVNASYIQKDLIVGKWKLDALKDSTRSIMTRFKEMGDTHLMKYHYTFTKEGFFELRLGDSPTKDSTRYEWTEKDQLTLKEYPTEKFPEVFKVSLLNKDSLSLQSNDSTIFLFTKAK